MLGVQISDANCAFSELRAVVADVGSERAGRDLSGMGQSGRPPLKRIDPGSIQGNPAGSLSGSKGRFQGDARSDDPNSMPVSVGRVFCVLLPTTRAQPVRMLGPTSSLRKLSSRASIHFTVSPSWSATSLIE